MPAVCFKNIRHKRALELVDSDYVRSIIMMMLDQSSILRYAYIDVKVHHLKAGQNTSNGLWHLDSSLNPDIAYDNYLFVTGEQALTEFITTPLQAPRSQNGFEFNRNIIEREFETARIRSCTITRYNGRNVHRGPISQGQESRLLVRVVKTNRRDMPSRMF